MITIKYAKELNEIVGFIEEQCYSLKTLEPIETPKILYEVLPFIKIVNTSKWLELPYGEEYEFMSSTLNVEYYSDYSVKIGNINFTLGYTRNEVGEKFYRLTGNLPKHILTQITELTSIAYYLKQEENDFFENFGIFLNAIFPDGTRTYTFPDLYKYKNKTGLDPEYSTEIPLNGIVVKYKNHIKYIPEKDVEQAKKIISKYNYIKVEIQ